MTATKTERPRNIGLLFEHFRGAARPAWHLDRPFDVAPDRGTEYTVAGLADLVQQTSAALWSAGLRRGGRLAIVKDNHFDVVLLAAAAARLGAVAAMISNSIKPEILVQMMDRLEPTVLVASPGVLTDAEKAGIELVGAGTTTLVAGKDAGAFPADLQRVSDLLGEPVPEASPVANHEMMICTHTSGTTGVPKFVAHSADTLLGTAAKLETIKIPFLSTRPTDTIATCVPFVHGRGITWAAAQLILPPGKVVVIADHEPEGVAEVLAQHPPTTLEACPGVFQRWEGLTRTHPQVFSTVRAFISTFDAIHPRTVRSFLEATKQKMPVWGQVWGQSEVGPAVLGVYTLGKLRRNAGRASSVTSAVGRPLPFATRIKVVDPVTRKKVKAGEQGIVLVKTKGRCLTYLGEPERHREKLWDGWWNTGDIGVKTRTGNLKIIDREVDVIPGVSGIELESVLMERVPEISEMAIIGVPGRPPVPVLSTDDGTLPPEKWAKATADLPTLADPVVIDWDDFPRTGTWKVRRPMLREQLFETRETFGTGRWT